MTQQQAINIDIDKLKLVFGFARHGAPDADSLVVVDSVAKSTVQYLVEVGKRQAEILAKLAERKAAQEATGQPSPAGNDAPPDDNPPPQETEPPASEPPPTKKLAAVQEHGPKSLEAQVMRDKRREEREAKEAAEANNQRAAQASDGTLPA